MNFHGLDKRLDQHRTFHAATSSDHGMGKHDSFEHRNVHLVLEQKHVFKTQLSLPNNMFGL